MTKEMMLENSNDKFEELKEEQINEWINNGADPIDAKQLFEEMVTDVNYSDLDMDVYSDYTINERIDKYSKKINIT